METIKCCIACILPCGALDVVRIVHSNGRVEEISGGPVLAGEIMKAYPKHVLRKPPSTCPADGGGGGIVVTRASCCLRDGDGQARAAAPAMVSVCTIVCMYLRP